MSILNLLFLLLVTDLLHVFWRDRFFADQVEGVTTDFYLGHRGTDLLGHTAHGVQVCIQDLQTLALQILFLVVWQFVGLGRGLGHNLA